MKKVTLVITLFIFQKISAQNIAINNSNATPHASAMLDISSNTKGVLIPRMNSIERGNISNPANGLLVFDNTTGSFWFFAGTWKEVPVSANGGTPTGLASGDLNGIYPSPTVAKLQNLSLAAGVPLDKQILKWDGLNNQWKGLNDSLFLPYKAAYSDATELFSITNNSLSPNPVAVLGRRLGGSAIPFTSSIAVWGDNTNGIGVAASSNSGVGISAISNDGSAVEALSTNGVGLTAKSVNNSGISGISQSVDKPGIAGTNTNSIGNGFGVIGFLENTQGGAAVYGKNNAANGHAGLYEINNAANTASALKSVSLGSGEAVYGRSEKGISAKFENTNALNTYPTVLLENNSKGSSLYVTSTHSGLAGNAIDVISQGTGTGLSVVSAKGKAADFLVSDNTSTSDALNTSTNGLGSVAKFYKNNTNIASLSPAVLINNTSRGNALKITSLYSPSNTAGIDLNYDGQAYAVKVMSTNFGIYSNTTAVNGTSILGENYTDGFAVKGMSNSALADRGALTGINTGSGVGIYGKVNSGGIAIKAEAPTGGIAVSATASNPGEPAMYAANFSAAGYGMKAIASGNNGIAILGEGGYNISQSQAAIFRNLFNTNSKNVVDITSTGLGTSLYLLNDNISNNKPMINGKASGTGSFLLFENAGGTNITDIAKTGNITTAGTVTVKNNKGIVRNSTSTQLRMEILQADLVTPISGQLPLQPNQKFIIDINFATAFSAAPVVYVANIMGSINGVYAATSITSVTATSCKFVLTNTTNEQIVILNNSWKLVAMGAE